MTDNITVGDWGTIQIMRFHKVTNPNRDTASWKGTLSIPYTKYTIKESDMRIKTASFTSPTILI